jgi:hypothetical protein
MSDSLSSEVIESSGTFDCCDLAGQAGEKVKSSPIVSIRMYGVQVCKFPQSEIMSCLEHGRILKDNRIGSL